MIKDVVEIILQVTLKQVSPRSTCSTKQISCQIHTQIHVLNIQIYRSLFSSQ